MTDEKWEETIEQIEEKFGIKDRFKEKIEGGGIKETIEFDGPVGRMRLERTVKPKVLGIKTFYSRRAGTVAKKMRQITSDSEKVRFVRAYVFKQGKWIEFKLKTAFI